jgi:ethanolamine permease
MSRNSNQVNYRKVDKNYFEKRGLRRYAGVWSLWALGVGAVISGHFSGWNYGLATGGWGGMLAAAVIMAAMYLCLVFCIAEMSAALPHTGASYSFARTAMGTWGGFFSGLCENVEYVMTPAVICFFIGSYLGSIFDSDLPPWMWWIGTYFVFLFLNILGVAMSFRVTLIITLTSLAILLVFCVSALPYVDIGRWALNIAPDGSELAQGYGHWFPTGLYGIFATLPYAVWLFLAIEELPLASEESIDPQVDMPRGILLALATLVATAFMVVILNPAVVGVGSYKLGASGEPLLDGFRAIFGGVGATLLGLIALSGLIASFHAILFAQGRQIFSLSRAGYFPTALSITHRSYKTPHVAMLSGSALGLAIMIVMWNVLGGKEASALIGSVLLNMAVFGAMLSYIFRAISFIILRRHHLNIARPYQSPFGMTGAWITIVISVLTLFFQVQDPNFTKGVAWVIAWFAVALIYFALIGRHRLILSPEEAFAVEQKARSGPAMANPADIPAAHFRDSGIAVGGAPVNLSPAAAVAYAPLAAREKA